MFLDVRDRPKLGQWLLLAIQHVFAMFGATVLVPLLTGLDIGVALIASGIGTLIYILCTRAKVPMYLGSSFAYIGAIIASASLGAAFVGIMAVGLVYIAIAIVIHFVGTKWLHRLLPPVVIGPMIIIIGLSLAGIAVGNIGLSGVLDWKAALIGLITFISTVVIAIKGKGFIKVIPFIVAILIGYIVSAAIGIVDWSWFNNVSFFQVPNFSIIGTYTFDTSALLIFLPLSLVTIAEHIGDHVVLGEIVGEDYLSSPGLSKTLMGDGIATLVAGSIGGPANTSYGENTSVVGITKVASVWVTGLAAVIAILLGFLGYLQAFIASVPWPVIGGMTIVLYGFIAGNGVKVLIKNKIDLGNIRNLIIVATMLVIGLGGAVITIGSVSLTGMSLAMVVGIILNLVFSEEKKSIE